MFCKKCGQPMDEGAKFCKNCGTPVEIPQTEEAPANESEPVAAPVDSLSNQVENEVPKAPAADEVNAVDQNGQYAQPTDQSDGAAYGQYAQPIDQPDGAAYGQFSQNDGQTTAKKKSKKGIIIAAVAVFAALAVALGVFVVPSLFAGSPKNQLKKMGMDSIKAMTAALDKSGERLDTGFSTNAKIIPGEGLLALLDASGYTISPDVYLGINQSSSKDGTSAIVTLGNKNGELINAKTMLDNESGNMYLSIPQINTKVLEIPVNQTSELTEDLNDTVNIKYLFPDSDAFNIFLSDSYEIFVDGVGEVISKSDNLVVGDITQKCTMLSADVTQRELIDIIIEIVENSKDDEEFTEFMNTVLSDIDLSKADAKNYDELADKIIEELNGTEPTDDVVFKFSVWTENGRDAAGVKIDVDNGYFYYTALSNGNEWAFDLGMVAGDSLTVSGNGTKNGNMIDGSATVSYNDDELLGLDLVNVDEQSGDGSYTVYIKDGIKNIAKGVDSSVLTIIKTAKIEINKSKASEGERILVTVYGAGTELLTVDGVVVDGTNTTIAIPEGQKETDLEKWGQSTDVYYLLGLMSKIGLY